MLTALAATALSAVGTLRATALDPAYWDSSLHGARVYERIYTELLADPALDRMASDLFGGLPVSRSFLDSNLRTVLPPEELRLFVNAEVVALTAYLRGETRDLHVAGGIRSLGGHVRMVADKYVLGLITNTPSFRARSYSEFVDRLNEFARDAAAGRLPSFLPSVALGPKLAGLVTPLLLRGLTAAETARYGPEVHGLLAEGKLNEAFTLVVPLWTRPAEAGAVRDLNSRLRGYQLTVKLDLASIPHERVVHQLVQARKVVGWALGPGLVVLVAAFLGGLALVSTGPARRRSRRWGDGPGRDSGGGPGGGVVSALGAALLIAAGVALAAGVAARLLLGDPVARLVSTAGGLPPSARAILDDLRDRMLAGIARPYLLGVFGLAVVGAAALIAGAGAPAPAAHRTAARRRVPVRAWTAAGVVVALVTVAVTAPKAVAAPPAGCNGHHALCRRPYNTVVYAGAHNAMATSDDRFIGALQDPTVTGQLDDGVRALLIDSHYWEIPAKAVAALHAFDPLFAASIRGLVETAAPSRPGLWLCHVACQLGALPAVDALRRIGSWMRAHPREVVTVVNEDDTVRPADFVRAVTEAGVLDLVAVPPREPAGPWPTLGDMIGTGHRLVVFSESHDGPAPWYRNLYRYAAETPYDHVGPHTVSCAANRGKASAPIFLMNHWITKDPGSRLDAGVLNRRSFILDQAAYCRRTRHLNPTIIAVDFVTIGEVTAAVDALNRIAPGDHGD